jgi:excisionase family DNA binding protein
LAETVLTPAELANRWKCTPGIVRRMIQDGRLRGFRVGDRYRVNLREVERHEGLEGGSYETDKEKALAALDR